MWVCRREMWKRQKESDESVGGGHFTAAAANGFSGLMRISSRGRAPSGRSEREAAARRPPNTRARPGSKTFYFFSALRMPRRLIAAAHLFQPFSNYRQTYRARNARAKRSMRQVPKGEKGSPAGRSAPAAGGVMQKAAHRCNAACIKQLLCGFCSRSTQHWTQFAPLNSAVSLCAIPTPFESLQIYFPSAFKRNRMSWIGILSNNREFILDFFILL